MDDPLLDKMQQLMGKYQPSSLASGETDIQGPYQPDDKQTVFPVLTDIVKLGDAVFQAGTDAGSTGPTENPAAQPEDTANQIARQILAVIDAQLKNQIDTLITPRLQHAMDETLAVLLPQLVVNIEAVIHETIIQECSRRGITFRNDENG